VKSQRFFVEINPFHQIRFLIIVRYQRNVSFQSITNSDQTECSSTVLNLSKNSPASVHFISSIGLQPILKASERWNPIKLKCAHYKSVSMP
jgi:hypothetical protein